MNKSIIGIIVAVALLVAGGYLFLQQNQSSELPPSDPGIVVPSSPESAPIIDPEEVEGL